MVRDPLAQAASTVTTAIDASRNAGERGGGRPAVLPLDDERARESALAGAKAAALARAKASGLPVLPGFVIVTTAAGEIEGRGWEGATADQVRGTWSDLSHNGSRPLVVRSSSTVEDRQKSSMAGRFTSVIGAQDWDHFQQAVDEVLASRRDAARGEGSTELDQPLAVLVQPVLEARTSGVMFGVDPVSGRSDTLVVTAVAGAPDKLVSGAVEGTRYELHPTGSQRSRRTGTAGARLRRRELRSLARLAADVAGTFGGPQDVEWAIDGQGHLWLLQSRPVTTEERGVPS
ncbi:MAG: PEP/pyruvate-binding domain-containing protein, partial [Actinomycetota bacterium]|nr:PEP/pyruvate-binding domain-containing protein [Actinomycetota bacterium]